MKLERIYESGAMPVHIGAGSLCAVLLLLGWVFGLGPLLSESHQATSVLEQAEQAEHDAKLSKNKLDALAGDLQDIQTQLDAQPVNLSSAAKINPLLAELAKWSEVHDLSITRTRAGRPEALAYYDYVPIEIAGEGAYGNVMAFLQSLHKDRGDLGVVAFDIRRMPASGGVNFVIELAWYVTSDADQVQTDQATAAVRSP